MSKMYLSLWTDVYVIFLYQNTHFISGFFFETVFYACFVFGFIYLFGSIVFSVSNILTLVAFGCSIFVINLCELLQTFSSDLFQYCC